MTQRRAPGAGARPSRRGWSRFEGPGRDALGQAGREPGVGQQSFAPGVDAELRGGFEVGRDEEADRDPQGRDTRADGRAAAAAVALHRRRTRRRGRPPTRGRRRSPHRLAHPPVRLCRLTRTSRSEAGSTSLTPSFVRTRIRPWSTARSSPFTFGAPDSFGTRVTWRPRPSGLWAAQPPATSATRAQGRRVRSETSHERTSLSEAAGPEGLLQPPFLRLVGRGEPPQGLGRVGDGERRHRRVLLGEPLAAHPLVVEALALEEQLERGVARGQPEAQPVGIPGVGDQVTVALEEDRPSARSSRWPSRSTENGARPGRGRSGSPRSATATESSRQCPRASRRRTRNGPAPVASNGSTRRSPAMGPASSKLPIGRQGASPSVTSTSMPAEHARHPERAASGLGPPALERGEELPGGAAGVGHRLVEEERRQEGLPGGEDDAAGAARGGEGELHDLACREVPAVRRRDARGSIGERERLPAVALGRAALESGHERSRGMEAIRRPRRARVRRAGAARRGGARGARRGSRAPRCA